MLSLVEEYQDCARYGELEELTEFLERKQVGVDAKDSQGNTALHKACANGHLACVELLLKHKASHLSNNDGNTPLAWAILNKQEKVVEALLGKHPDIDVLKVNRSGKSPMSTAFDANHQGILKMVLEHQSAAALEDKAKAEETELSDSASSATASWTHRFRLGAEHAASSSAQTGSCSGVILVRELANKTTALPESKKDLDVLGLEGGTDVTGLFLWAEAVVMSQWLVDPSSEAARTLSSRPGGRVLELGAGCGMAGLTAAMYSPCGEVVLSDLTEEAIDNLKHNIKINSLQEEPTASSDTKDNTKTALRLPPSVLQAVATKCSTALLDWCKPSSWPSTRFDVALGCGVIYNKSLVPALVATVDTLLSSRDGATLLLCHTEKREGVPLFVSSMEEKGFRHSMQECPAAYTVNPLPGVSDTLTGLHFSELFSNKFYLHLFERIGEKEKEANDLHATGAAQKEETRQRNKQKKRKKKKKDKDSVQKGNEVKQPLNEVEQQSAQTDESANPAQIANGKKRKKKIDKGRVQKGKEVEQSGVEQSGNVVEQQSAQADDSVNLTQLVKDKDAVAIKLKKSGRKERKSKSTRTSGEVAVGTRQEQLDAERPDCTVSGHGTAKETMQTDTNGSSKGAESTETKGTQRQCPLTVPRMSYAQALRAKASTQDQKSTSRTEQLPTTSLSTSHQSSAQGNGSSTPAQPASVAPSDREHLGAGQALERLSCPLCKGAFQSVDRQAFAAHVASCYLNQ